MEKLRGLLFVYRQRCGFRKKVLNETLTFENIPELDVIVYLRENSNISTGGDSIDFTDDIHQSYKDIAVKATKALDVENLL